MQATGTPSDGTVLPASIASSGHFKIPQLTVNEDGADVDFRVEGDTNANLLFVNAGTDRIGIGTSSPDGLLHVLSGSAGSVTAATDANDLVLEASTNVGISLLTANDSQARIKFGDPDATNAGSLIYNHQNDKLSITTATGNRMIIGSDMISARTAYGILRTTGGYTFRETNEGNERAGIHSNSSNDLIFKTASAAEKMRIQANGLIGIGTTSPTGFIHIEGSSNGTETYGRFSTGSANGDQNLYIQSGSSRDHMALQVKTGAGANDDLSLNPSGGNVGIGTTSPTNKLEVVDSDFSPIYTRGSGNVGGIRFGNNTHTNGFIYYDNGPNMNFQVGGSERMRIDSSGNLGLGTTNPLDKLAINYTVSSSVPSGGIRLQDDTNTTVTVLQTTFSSYNYAGVSGHYSQLYSSRNLAIVADGANSGSIQCMTGNAERMRITSGGDLVLNSDTARVYNGHTPRLSVQGTNFSQSTVAITSNSTGSDGAYLFFAKQRSGSVGGSTAVANNDLVGQFRYLAGDGTDTESEVANITVSINGTPGSNDTPGRITFATTNDGGNVSTERMRISSTGAVGIGTTSPNYILHAKGGAVDQTARFDNTKTGDNDINYIGVGLNTTTTGSALFGHTGHSTTAFQAAWMGVAGDDVAGGTGVKAFKGGTIQMNGVLNIGNNNQPRFSGARIATSSGSFGALFETTGNTAANGIPLIVNRQADNGVMIEFKVANNVVATILRNSSNLMVYGGQSDYRLKENNVAISDSLTKVKSLKPYEFNWKDLPDTKVLGFIAHELQEVVPQAVTGTKDEMYEDDDTKPKYQNVDNSHIVPLLVAALQEAISKIETLETKVAALKSA
jgi:hypothetical protein